MDEIINWVNYILVQLHYSSYYINENRSAISTLNERIKNIERLEKKIKQNEDDITSLQHASTRTRVIISITVGLLSTSIVVLTQILF